MTTNIRVVCTNCLVGKLLVRVDIFLPTEKIITVISNAPPATVTHVFERRVDNDRPFVYEEWLTVHDTSGLIFRFERARLPDLNNLNNITELPPDDCVNPCSEFEILCDSDHYPGWICKPIEPMSNSVVKMYHNYKG